jgi:hypothetical protein
VSSFQGRRSPYSIATNVCLRAVERRPSRVLPIDYGPPAAPHEPIQAPLLERLDVRAREAEERRPDCAQHATLRSLGDRQLKEIVQRYVDACAHHGVDTIVDSSGVQGPHGVSVVALEAERIDEIIHFRTPSMVGLFGLPSQA